MTLEYGISTSLAQAGNQYTTPRSGLSPEIYNDCIRDSPTRDKGEGSGALIRETMRYQGQGAHQIETIHTSQHTYLEQTDTTPRAPDSNPQGTHFYASFNERRTIPVF